MARIKDKRVVVLGASRGVGREIVLRAHGEGGRVLAVARGEGRARALGRRGAGNRDICARRGLRGCSKPRLRENDARLSRRLRRREALAREHSRSDLGSVHRQLGKRRQNVVLLLRSGFANAARAGVCHNPDFERRGARRLANLRRLRPREAHADVLGRLRAKGVRPAWSGHSICFARTDENHARDGARESRRRRLCPAPRDPVVGFRRRHDGSTKSGQCRGRGASR